MTLSDKLPATKAETEKPVGRIIGRLKTMGRSHLEKKELLEAMRVALIEGLAAAELSLFQLEVFERWTTNVLLELDRKD